jgi:hypothetical protein
MPRDDDDVNKDKRDENLTEKPLIGVVQRVAHSL